MLDGQSAAGPDLGFHSFGERDGQSRRDQFSLSGMEYKISLDAGMQIVACALVGRLGRELGPLPYDFAKDRAHLDFFWASIASM